MIRLAALAALFPAPAEAACRLALALALDISSSVNDAEYALQIGGVAAALRDPEVREAILTQDGEVRMMVYEWSGYYQQDIVADWTEMTSPIAIDWVAGKLESHVREYSVYPTAIGRALEFGAAQFRRLPVPCERQVIDVSGDGVNNLSADPKYYRRIGTLDGIVINGLVIKGSFPDPEAYYRSQVISGPGAFLMVARGGFEDYPEMIREKLLREIRPDVLIGLAR